MVFNRLDTLKDPGCQVIKHPTKVIWALHWQLNSYRLAKERIFCQFISVSMLCAQIGCGRIKQSLGCTV